MALSDVGSGLQILGGVIEIAALVLAARRIDRNLRQRRWAHAEERLETQLEVISKAATGDPEGAERLISAFLSDQIGDVYDTFGDVTTTPVRLFVLGIGVTIVGVTLAAGWF